MTNTLLRSGRSAVLNMARDFSCALVTAEQRAARVGRGPAGPRDRHGVPRRGDDRPPRRHRRGRRVPAQRPLPRQLARRRPRDPRAGLRRRRARLHRLREGAPGRLRQLAADDLHARRARRLRGGRADLPVRPRPARLPRHRRRDPHVPAADPRARAVVRRLPRHARRRADRRAAAGGAVRRSTGSTTIREFVAEWFDYSEQRMAEAIQRAARRRRSSAARRTTRTRACPTASRCEVTVTIDADARHDRRSTCATTRTTTPAA